VIVARDIRLVEHTGGRAHIAHVSCAATVEMLRDAQRRGLRVTGEVTPHHLLFTDERLATYDTNFKMAPPLREESDRLALIEGLREGVLTAVATDHAPHNEILKDREFDYAPNGVVGCETAFASLYTGLVKTGVLDLHTLIERMSLGPAAALGIAHGGIVDGGPADFTVLDLEATWEVKVGDFAGKSANSPWLGETLQGLPVVTVCEGHVIFEANPAAMAVPASAGMSKPGKVKVRETVAK
jgi:dihydroorotase